MHDACRRPWFWYRHAINAIGLGVTVTVASQQLQSEVVSI